VPDTPEQRDPYYLDRDDPADMSGSGEDPFPWPPREGDSLPDAWGRTWAGASLAPRRFFTAMPASGSLGPAILYYLSIGIAVAGAQLFWAMIRGPDTADDAIVTVGPWDPLVDFLMSPLYLMLSLFVAAGVVHVLLRLMGGAGGDYRRTLRVFAFAYSPQILGVIPVAGVVVGFVWMVIVAIVGVREAHDTTTARSAVAILIPLLIALAFVIVAQLIVRAGGLLDMPL
jgi:hypothetical protein